MYLKLIRIKFIFSFIVVIYSLFPIVMKYIKKLLVICIIIFMFLVKKFTNQVSSKIVYLDVINMAFKINTLNK